MRTCILFLAALLLQVSSQVRADPLLLGNFAGDVGPVDIHVNGQRVAAGLDYLDVASIDQPRGSLTISARSATSGAELAALQVVFKAAISPVQPMLLLASTGEQGAPELWLQQESRLDVADFAERFPDSAFLSIINASTIESTESLDSGFQLQYQLACQRSRTSGSGFGLPQLEPIEWLTTVDAEVGSLCTLQLGFTPAGAFEVSAIPVRSRESVRFLIVGNGETIPFQLAVLAGDQLHAVADAIEVEPGPLLPSNQFWFDRSRPAQGVALFEMPGAGLLHGTWQTFNTSGEAVWYLLDGAARNLPGDRDLTIFAVDMEDGLRLTPAGTGRLTYFNCNEAEARFALSGQPVRFLRLERSEPVDQCYALE